MIRENILNILKEEYVNKNIFEKKGEKLSKGKKVQKNVLMRRIK